MRDREESERSQLHCRNCSAQARQGNVFCVSCGERLNVEGATRPVIRGSGSRNRSLLDQENTKVALYAAGALLLLVVVYLLLSYSVLLGFVLIGLSVLAVLVIRKNRGDQTRLEQRVFEKAGRYGGSARKVYEEGKHRELAQNAYRQSREAYEEANTRYRRWSESQATERKREARRRRLECYVSFFERALSGSQRSLDWWQAYQDEELDNGQPSTSVLLRSAVKRSEAGLAKVRRMEGTLDRLLQEDSFEEADRLLDDVRAGQEDLRGDESVFSSLVAVHERVKRLDNWANYRENFERLVKDLEDQLGSPKVRTAAANRLRFPNPGGMPSSSLGDTRSPDAADKRSEPNHIGGSEEGMSSVSDTSLKESTQARPSEWTHNLLLLAVITVGVLIVGKMISDSCIGCGGTDPKDKSHARHLSGTLKAGVSNVDEKIKIEEAKVNGSSATVTVSGDVTDKDARYLCDYTLDASRALLKYGEGAGGIGERVLEAQVKRPGIFNDTTCEQ